MKKNGESKINHLQMIQSVISRMGNNSFSIKGWTIAIMVALYALIGEEDNNNAIFIATIPILVMWLLDAYYLLLERKFRRLYDDVRKKNEDEIDFDMNFNSIDIKMSETKKYNIFNILFSTSVFPFYVVWLLATIIMYS